MRRAAGIAGLALAAACALPARAQTAQVLDLPSRPGVQQRVLALRPAGEAAATLVLLPGGDGQVGIFGNGSLRNERNFLTRTRMLFVEQGFAVVLVDTPSDRRDLGGNFREGAENAADVGAAIAWARRTVGKPVWVVGTSRGTHSAANAALRLQGDAAPDGVVLTSTVLDSSRFGSSTARPVQEMGVEKLRVPVLVVHHAGDGCAVTPPQRLPELMARLPAGAELLTYTEGRSQGALCEALSHHGFNGIEERVVADVAAWIRRRP